ncbi:MAG: hypothetical protein ACOCVZ_00980 [Gemmatimonadota bacterium]
MGHRQLADHRGHRWDVEDEGPLRAQEGPEGEGAEHRLRFTRDDGTEEVRTAPRSLDQLADAQLRTILDAGDLGDAPREPDLEANRSRGYGGARD